MMNILVSVVIKFIEITQCHLIEEFLEMSLFYISCNLVLFMSRFVGSYHPYCYIPKKDQKEKGELKVGDDGSSAQLVVGIFTGSCQDSQDDDSYAVGNSPSVVKSVLVDIKFDDQDNRNQTTHYNQSKYSSTD